MLLKFSHLLQTYSVAFLALHQAQSCGPLLDSQMLILAVKQKMAALNKGLESSKISLGQLVE